MTEDEAKAKWCPFAMCATGKRVNGGSEMTMLPAHNRIASVVDDRLSYPAASLCIASACMAWRWTMPPRSGIEYDPNSSATQKVVQYPGQGYCGLAGGAR